MRWLCVVVLLASVCVGQSMRSGEEKKNPLAGQKAAIEAGAHRFREGCAACHGANAQGGRGPRLVQNRDLYGMTDEHLFDTIRRGIPGTSMPPSQMADEQTWQVVAYVRSLNSPASQAVIEGDPARGRAFFYDQVHCNRCHAIRGEGGEIGPDLSNVGAMRTVAELRQSLETPSARITPGFEAVSVHLKSGAVIKGVAKDDSTYSIQVLDSQGNLHLLSKRDVSSIEWSHKSLMPDNVAQQLGPTGVDDVIAFLAQQVIRPGVTAARRRWRDIQ